MTPTGADMRANSRLGQGHSKLPLVSVVIPCYQQGCYLAESIASVLEQSYPRVEAIVVNDGSTDNTAEVAGSFGNAIKYLFRQNGGLSAARNTGLCHCAGEYVVFLDADDVLMTGMTARMVANLQANPDCDAAHCGYMVTPEDCRDTNWVGGYGGQGDLFDCICFENLFVVHAAMTRRSVLSKAGLFDTTLGASEDWDLWLRIANLGVRWVRVPEVLVKYRQHRRSLGKTFESVLSGTRAVHARAKAMAAARGGGNIPELERKFRRAWGKHVLRIAALLAREDRLDECRLLVEDELGAGLGDMNPEEAGRWFWGSFSGAVGIPASDWERTWISYGRQLTSFVALMHALSGREDFGGRFLSGFEPLCGLSAEQKRLRAIEGSNTYQLARQMAKLKFW